MLTTGRDVTKSVARASYNTYVFFHFVSQEELIAKVILLQCTKLIAKVSYLFAIFLNIYISRASRWYHKEMSEV